jgi:hypothetical protein
LIALAETHLSKVVPLPSGRPIAEFRCERGDLFSKLSDPKWFHDFVEYQYKRVVFNMEPVSPILSEYWIAQAHYRWTKDIEHTSEKEYGTDDRITVLSSVLSTP